MGIQAFIHSIEEGRNMISIFLVHICHRRCEAVIIKENKPTHKKKSRTNKESYEKKI